MIPIPYFFDIINRNAFVVKPKKPYIDWANAVFDEKPTDFSKVENNIYLIREMDSNEEVAKWIKRNFDQIFQNELNDWCTDKKRWPQKRTYKLFTEWFDVEISSMVLDIEDDPVEKDL
jgi:hypothetical protein